MTLLQHASFICLDCEMTGLDLEKDRIIEIAAIRFSINETFETFETLISPDCPLNEASTLIHGINESMLIDKPKIETILPDFLKFLDNKNSILIGHGLSFDLEMLALAAKRASIANNIPSYEVFDTLRLARSYGNSPNNSLQALAKHFNIPVDGAHRAMNDVVTNIKVFKHLVKKFKDVNQLRKTLAKPIKMNVMPLGKHKGRPLSEIPLSYLSWAANFGFDEDLSYSIKQEILSRKKGKGFLHASNPFSEI